MVHHHHLVGHVGNNAQVVRDYHHGHLQFRLQLLDQLQYLGLDRDIQRCCRFIGNQQGRTAHQGHRDHGALTQTAGKLERVGVLGFGRIRETHQAQHLDHCRAALRLAQGAAVQGQRLADLIAYGVQGRQRRHRLLENDGNAATADRLHLLALHVEFRDVDHRFGMPGVAQQDFSLLDSGDPGQDAHDALRHDGLAGAAFTHQGHRAASRDTK